MANTVLTTGADVSVAHGQKALIVSGNSNYKGVWISSNLAGCRVGNNLVSTTAGLVIGVNTPIWLETNDDIYVFNDGASGAALISYLIVEL